MKTVTLYKNDDLLLPEVGVADNFFTRFKGLMFRKEMPLDYGLFIKPCNQIHTFNMKFDIDVVYLSAENKVVHIDDAVKPGKVCKTVHDAKNVLELNAGIAYEKGISEGDILEFRSDNKS